MPTSSQVGTAELYRRRPLLRCFHTLLVLPLLTTVLVAGEDPTRTHLVADSSGRRRQSQAVGVVGSRKAAVATAGSGSSWQQVQGRREELACQGDSLNGRLTFSVQGSEGLAKLQSVEDVLATIIEGLLGFCHATVRISGDVDPSSSFTDGRCEPSCQVVVSYRGTCLGRCFVAPLDEVGHLDKSIRYGLAQRGLHFRVFASKVSLSELPDLHGAQLAGGSPEDVHAGERKRRWRKNLLVYWILPALFLSFLVCAISAVGHTCKGGKDASSRDRVGQRFAKEQL